MSRARRVKKLSKQVEACVTRSGRYAHISERQFRRAERACQAYWPWSKHVVADALKVVPTLRKYAGYRAWKRNQKAIPEIDVARNVAQYLGTQGDLALTNLRPAEHDPPDVLANDVAGRIVGIEIVELVDPSAVRANEQRGDEPPVMRFWTESEVLGRVDQLVKGKDGKKYLGGPFGRIIVAVHTDEPDVRYDAYAPALRGLTIAGLKQVDEVYVVFSYDPAQDGCPVVPVKAVRA